MRIKLNDQSIAFAIEEGKEIFRNSRSLNYHDTEQTKINNCLIGAFGQQVFIEGTNGRRVTKEECPDFTYDVECVNLAVKAYSGWKDRRAEDAISRCEIKVRPMENRKWVSFNDQMMRHATRSAKAGLLDYIVFYGIRNIELSQYEADVVLAAIVLPEVICDDLGVFRRPSLYTKGESFLNKGRIHERNAGKIFL